MRLKDIASPYGTMHSATSGMHLSLHGVAAAGRRGGRVRRVVQCARAGTARSAALALARAVRSQAV